MLSEVCFSGTPGRIAKIGAVRSRAWIWVFSSMQTTTLFAGLEIATGLVTDRCFDRHTNVEFLAFLKQVARAYPRVPLHVVCDNYATHKHPNVTAWLTKHPRVQLHFTPTSGSWLN